MWQQRQLIGGGLLTPGGLSRRALAQVIARDSFTRSASVGTGIGSADRGGAWTLSATGLISINGSQLVAALTAGTNRHATLPTNARNTKTYFEFQGSALVTSGTMTFAAIARSISASEQLRFKVLVDSAAAIKVQGFTISPSFDAGAETSIAASATVTRLGSFTVSTKYRMCVQVKDTLVRIKAWKRSQSEPAAWDWSSTQTKLTVAGGNGWRILAPSGNAATITLDDFLVRDTTGFAGLEQPTETYSGTFQALLDDTTGFPNGTTAILPSTTYYEVLTVPANRTLTLRAATDGGPIVSAYASTPITAGWSQVAATPVYSQALAYEAFGLMVSGRPFLKFDTLAHLTNALFANGTTDAVPEGFYSDGTTLYLRLDTGLTPNGTSVYVTRSGLTTGAAGTGLTIPSTSSITLEGITFEGWPRRGIFVDESATLIARRCWLHNNWHDIEDPSTTTTPTSHIRLEHCTFTMRGTSGTYNGPWAIHKYLGFGAHGSAGGTNGIYGSNLGNSAATVITCDDFQAYRCVVHDKWDAFQVKGRYRRALGGVDYGWANRTSYIRECLFWRLDDNAEETETGDRWCNIEVDHNIAVDCFQPFAMAPFLTGRVDVHHNIQYISEDWWAESAAVLSKIFKVSSAGIFTGAASGSGVAIGDDLAIQMGIHIYNNTFIGGRSTTQRGKLYDADKTDWTFSDCYFRDNIAIHTNSFAWELGGFVLSQYNLLWHGGSYTASFNLNDYKHASIGGSATIWNGTGVYLAVYDTRPVVAPLSTDPLLGATSTTLFNLTASSPARGAASDGGDLGAVAYGAAWSMPLVGCQWAACTAVLPSVPASIAASQMGLA